MSSHATATKSQPELKLPEFPVTINRRGVLDSKIYNTVELNKLDYEIFETQSGEYIIKMSLSGKCTYSSNDNQYRHSVQYKLYNSNGAVASSGLFYLPLLAEGDNFENIQTSEISLEPDTYSIVFVDS